MDSLFLKQEHWWISEGYLSLRNQSSWVHGFSALVNWTVCGVLNLCPPHCKSSSLKLCLLPVSSSESDSSEPSSGPANKLCELENFLINFLIHLLTSPMLRLSRMLWGWFGNVRWLRPGTSLNTSLWSSSFTIISNVRIRANCVVSFRLRSDS